MRRKMELVKRISSWIRKGVGQGVTRKCDGWLTGEIDSLVLAILAKKVMFL